MIAFGLVVGRLAGRKPFRDAHDLAAERLELELDRLILDPAVGVEDSRGRSDRDNVRDGPTAQRSDGELHRVDRLQPLGPARRADQPDHFVMQIRRLARAEQV